MKTINRFYKRADAAPVESQWAVRLDGRPVRTPGGRHLHLPSRSLAEAVAKEWDAQGEKVQPDEMPLMQLCATALDRAEGEMRGDLQTAIAKYGESDLLCYRAETPTSLIERQTAHWDPVLTWFATRFDVAPTSTAGVMPVWQPEELGVRVQAILGGMDAFTLTVVSAVTAATGSLFLALALVEERLTAEDVITAAQIDETHQVEQWGDDEEAAERRARLAGEVQSAARLLHLARH